MAEDTMRSALTSSSSSGGFAAALEVFSEPVGGVGEERRPLPPTFIVLVPAFNESATIARVVTSPASIGLRAGMTRRATTTVTFGAFPVPAVSCAWLTR